MSGPVLCVGAVVLRNRERDPEVLLIRRAKAPRAGQWSLPGGRVEAGEPLLNALRRELREETGLEVKPGPLLEVVELLEGGHWVVLDYFCEPAGPGDGVAGDDAAELRWAPAYELAEFGLTPAVLRVIARALTLGEARE